MPKPRYSFLYLATSVLLVAGCASPVDHDELNIAQRQVQSSVPFYDQKDNAEEGWRACNITSMAMVLDYYGVTNPMENGKRTPDYLYEQFGILQQPEQLRDLFNQVAQERGSSVRNVLYKQGTIAQLRARARAGKPSVIHGWFTESGHILVVTGYDGEFYTVNDPYGKWLGQKYQPSSISYDEKVSGQGLKYPAEAFEHAINDNGTGDDLWLHTFELITNQ